MFKWLRNHSRKRRQLRTIGVFDGHQFRAFNRIEDLPPSRYLRFIDHIGFVNTTMTRPGLLAYANLILEAVNANELTKVAFYATQFHQEVEAYDPAKNLLRIGSLIILMDHEDPDGDDDLWIKEKSLMFDKSAEFRAFYLKATYLALQKYGILEADLTDETFLGLILDQHEQAYSMVTGRRIYWGFSNS